MESYITLSSPQIDTQAQHEGLLVTKVKSIEGQTQCVSGWDTLRRVSCYLGDISSKYMNWPVK